MVIVSHNYKTKVLAAKVLLKRNTQGYIRQDVKDKIISLHTNLILVTIAVMLMTSSKLVIRTLH